MRTYLVLTVAMLFVPAAKTLAQRSARIVLRPGDFVWQPAPPVLEPGAEAAILAGNPAQPGVVTIRVRVPDKYRIAPHWHSVDEYVTVMSGNLCFVIGEQGGSGQASCLGAGGFALIPAKAAHSVCASGATEYQIQAVAPFEMTYLNAADDPSQRRR
jgi:quercetin dioxygenase-like cupin family protein